MTPEAAQLFGLHVGETVPYGVYTNEQGSLPGFGTPSVRPYRRIDLLRRDRDVAGWTGVDHGTVQIDGQSVPALLGPTGSAGIPRTPVVIVGTATMPAVGSCGFFADHPSMGSGALLAADLESAAYRRAQLSPDPTLNGPQLVSSRSARCCSRTAPPSSRPASRRARRRPACSEPSRG